MYTSIYVYFIFFFFFFKQKTAYEMLSGDWSSDVCSSDLHQIAVLEMGWTSDMRPNSPYLWHAVTEDQKADYLRRAFVYARDNWPWVTFMTVIYFPDPSW